MVDPQPSTRGWLFAVTLTSTADTFRRGKLRKPYRNYRITIGVFYHVGEFMRKITLLCSTLSQRDFLVRDQQQQSTCKHCRIFRHSDRCNLETEAIKSFALSFDRNK